MAEQGDWVRTAPGRGLVVAAVLVAAAFAVPAIFGWDVHAGGSATPLSAAWQPRFGIGTVPAVVLAVLVVRYGPRLADRLSWPALLGATFCAGTAWLLALATVDGRAGLADVLARPDEYLRTARGVHDVHALLRGFVDRIPAGSDGHWPVHVAGHPPGALLFFVLLVRLGLGGGLAAGLVVTTLAATTPVAVMITLRRLGAGPAARRAAPVIAFGPSAIWSAVSADAVFACVAAWGLCALACAGTSGGGRRIAWSLLAGALLGSCVFLSYGLPLLAILAGAVLVAARTWRPLPVALLAALGVFAAFAAAGFVWWHGLTTVRTRYYAGVARLRPSSYWVWGDLAALTLSAGPVVGSTVGAALARVRRWGRATGPARVVVLLTVAALVSVVLADVSAMSKAEVERIWLPFVPWLLVAAALLPARWRDRALAGQVTLAVVIETLIHSHW